MPEISNKQGAGSKSVDSESGEIEQADGGVGG